MAWSGFGQMHLVRKLADVEESSGPCFWQNATGLLPDSSVQTLLRFSMDGLDHTAQNQPGSSWVLATLGFAQTDPVWKQASVQDSSGPLQANASELMIGCRSDLACLQGKRPLDHLASQHWSHQREAGVMLFLYALGNGLLYILLLYGPLFCSCIWSSWRLIGQWHLQYYALWWHWY